MTVIPLRWQSASRAERMRALVIECAEKWIAEWSAIQVGLGVEVETLPPLRPEIASADTRWYDIRDRRASLNLRVTGTSFEHLGCRLVGVAVADSSGLAAGLGRRAFTDLARGFLGPEAPARLIEIAGMPSIADIGARHGAIGFQVSIGGIRVELHFDAELCAMLLPIDGPSAKPLTSRRDALKPIDAEFEAELDLGPLLLAESISFKPGDVLRTAVPLDTSIRLRAHDGRGLVTGTLTVEGGHRALKIVKTHLHGDIKK
jgi:hypothetical protein